MYHSLIIYTDGKFINTWDDWYLIPSSRPVISPPIERTNFVTVPGRDGVLDYSQSVSKKAVYDNRTGKIEFYLENDIPGWDWETAYTTICETLKGKRLRFALEDNPGHYYEGMLWVNGFKSQKGNSTITLEYNVHPTMYSLEVTAVTLNLYDTVLANRAQFQLKVGVAPSNTFYRKVNIRARPYGIVEIDQNGVVRGVREGVAEISVSCGKVSAVCSVTVTDSEYHVVKRSLTGCIETNPADTVTHEAAYENTIRVEDLRNATLEVSVQAQNGNAFTDVTADCVTFAKEHRQAEIKMGAVTCPLRITARAVPKENAVHEANVLPVEPVVLCMKEDGFRLETGKEG